MNGSYNLLQSWWLIYTDKFCKAPNSWSHMFLFPMLKKIEWGVSASGGIIRDCIKGNIRQPDSRELAQRKNWQGQVIRTPAWKTIIRFSFKVNKNTWQCENMDIKWNLFKYCRVEKQKHRWMIRMLQHDLQRPVFLEDNQACICSKCKFRKESLPFSTYKWRFK